MDRQPEAYQIREYKRNDTTGLQFTNSEQTLMDDYNQIIDGIPHLNYGEAAISTFCYSDTSFFPIIKVGQNSMMIAGKYGNGKLLLFGHPDIFVNSSQPNAHLIKNTLRWMCGTKELYNIGLFMDVSWNTSAFENAELSTHFQTITNEGQIYQHDVILINYYDFWPKELNESMLQTLKSYVQNGGNIIFGSHGWVWECYGEGSEDKSLKYKQSFASVKIIQQFGLFLKKDAQQLPQPYYELIRYDKSEQQKRIEDFLINDFLEVLNGAGSFKADDSSISHFLSEMEYHKILNNTSLVDTYHSLVDAFINSSFNIETNYDKIPMNEKLSNTVYEIMNSLSYSCPAQQCRALPPSLNKYPGYAVNKLEKKVISVYRNRNKRVYTGLYTNPGQAIRIKYLNDMNQLYNVQLKLNHNNNLFGRDNDQNLLRYPNIMKTIKIKNNQFWFASPHGGLLYFDIIQKSQSNEPLLFEFYEAYQAPYYNQQLHSPQDFKHIQSIDAPFFVFETKRIVIIGPARNTFKSLDINVQRICDYWNNVINVIKQFRGSDPYPFQKDSIFNDVQLMFGYMHSGNPVCTLEDVTLQFLGCSQKDITKQGNWGIYHQFGHNHQDYKWTTDELIEVTNNICSLYCFWRIHNQPALKSRWLLTNNEVFDRFKRHIKLPQDKRLQNYGKDALLGLYLFAILIDQFGFEVFKSLHRKYDKMDYHPETKQEKYQILAEKLSLEIGYNLWGYLKKWGFPITKSSKSKISHLKPYKCKRHPQLTV